MADVELGDIVNAVITAAAVVVAVVAAGIATKARSDSRRSADAAERAADAGEDSVEQARRSAAAGEDSAREARRSAAAGEDSAREARRSADAAERANTLATQEAQRQAAEREDQQGPHFEALAGSYDEGDNTVQFRLRMTGGPGRLDVDVTLTADWCTGFTVAGTTGHSGRIHTHHPLEDGAIIEGTVLTNDRFPTNHPQVVLPLQLTATRHGDHAKGEPTRRWERRATVPLDRRPGLAAF